MTVTVRSAGLGNKRALYVGAANNFSARDTNFVVSRTGAGAGSYIGVETNHANASVRIRLGYVDSPVTADVSQTLGELSLGATDLRNSNANAKGFTTILQPSLLVWADNGSLPSGATRYMRPGTGAVTSTEIKLRLNQKCIVQNLMLRAVAAPGAGKTDTFTVRKNGGDTVLVITLAEAETSKALSNVSVSFAAGDDVSVKVVPANATGTSDVVLTMEVF